MLAVISSANLVMIYDTNNHAIGYLTEYFSSKADAVAYAREVTTNIVFED